MAKTESSMLTLGTIAPLFRLSNGVDDQYYSRDQLMGNKGLLVFFICNHCPYVVHLIDHFSSKIKKYQNQGIGVVAISSNDILTYPDDSPELMTKFAQEHRFSFPYLFDSTQEVARNYQATCTPDFFLFDHNHSLIYRGRYDDSTPGNGIEISGLDLIRAIDALINGELIHEVQHPSMGCNIKWR